jgi:hypothetical protein
VNLLAARTPDRATALASLTLLPMMVWWLGWFPGIMSSDSIDQWNQAVTYDFYSLHPITHTAYLWGISLIWESPGAVALVQVLLTAILLMFVARRLVQIGVNMWIAVGAMWIIALLPMTGAMTIAIWKDVPFSLAMGWVFVELLDLARDRTRYWSRFDGPLRLGVALGLMWALRANGKLTVIVFAAALVIAFRGYRREAVVFVAAIVGVGIVTPMLVAAILPVTNQTFEPAAVFMSDVGAVIVHDPDAMSQADLDLAAAVAPLTVWQNNYGCGDSGPLVFNDRFDSVVIRTNPSAYRGLVVRTVLGAPLTVAGHRWCAGEYLLSPVNRTKTFVHRPRFDIWPNTIGLARDPISDPAYEITLSAYKLAEKSAIEWLTWRPAIFVLAGLVTYFGVSLRRRLRPLLWIGGLFVIHLCNVFITSPSHEFRYAYGLYLIALASLPLWELIAQPGRSTITESSSTNRNVESAATML